LKIAQEARIFGLLSFLVLCTYVCYVSTFDKNVLGLILGDFFTNSSGHHGFGQLGHVTAREQKVERLLSCLLHLSVGA
jgi:hypothetical protein